MDEEDIVAHVDQAFSCDLNVPDLDLFVYFFSSG